MYIPVIGGEENIPHLQLLPWKDKVMAAYTGPNSGITSLDLHEEGVPASGLPVAGVDDWNRPSERAYGISLSLYEEEVVEEYTTPKTKKKSSPIITSEDPVIKPLNGTKEVNKPTESQDDPFPPPPPLKRNKEQDATVPPPSLSPAPPPSFSPRLKRVAGEPIADVFAIVARENNTIMAIADGVNWGKKPRLAARCAVQTAIAYISSNIKRLNDHPTSRTLSSLLLEAMDNAQKCILEHNATLTTLSIGVVCELKPNKRLLTTSTPATLSTTTSSSSSSSWGLFTACVGDSPVYAYSPKTKTISEATVASHPKDGIRTAAFSGGALGPAVGTQPDTENLSLGYLPVAEGDIIFMTTDGVSDNFYPQIIRPGEYRDRIDRMSTSARDVESSSGFVMLSKDPPTSRLPPPSSSSRLVIRCCENIPEIADHLRQHESILNGYISAQTVAAALVNFAVELTDEKRRFFTDCKEKGIQVKAKSREDPEFDRIVKRLPGKLDHATVVACTVGRHIEAV